jgi:galactose mutarotase-like enzyme
MASASPSDQALTIASDLLEATFRPGLGLLGTSIRHRGTEVLDLSGGLDGYRAGHVTGLSLLAPWANRLGSLRYEAAGVAVDVVGLDLSTDGNGLPIHGTMTAQAGWEVGPVDDRSFSARFDFGARPDLLASFPFPHRLRVDVAVEHTTLRVATTVEATADRAVPITFGYHPYLCLPGIGRADVLLRLPERRHLDLDERQLPTGRDQAEAPDDEPIGSRRFDDLYALGDDRRLAIHGGGRAITLELGEGYRYFQVFTPPAGDSVCLEPMTAAVNALVDGGFELARPGSPVTATFSLRVDDGS